MPSVPTIATQPAPMLLLSSWTCWRFPASRAFEVFSGWESMLDPSTGRPGSRESANYKGSWWVNTLSKSSVNGKRQVTVYTVPRAPPAWLITSCPEWRPIHLTYSLIYHTGFPLFLISVIFLLIGLSELLFQIKYFFQNPSFSVCFCGGTRPETLCSGRLCTPRTAVRRSEVAGEGG